MNSFDHPDDFSAADVREFPALRSDLEIRSTAETETGEAAWLIYDPLQQRYFHIDHRTRELLLVWNLERSIASLVKRAEEQLGLHLSNDDVANLLAFLQSANLMETNGSALGQPSDAHRKADTIFSPSQLIKRSLFFKLSLIKSDRFLRILAPYADPLFSWKAAALVGFIGFIGIYLISRQWAVFSASFSQAFSLEGIAGLAISLLALKMAHELGHALTAIRLGCHVSSMGVAFMVFTPVLYTDVSDAWRLSSRRERMLVSGAGVAVELAIACIATCLWVFLPEGAVRGIVFVLATSAWIISFAFNLNPFMKFDGYFVLSDLLKIDNLQQRAFAMGRWKMREILFAPAQEPPEFFAPRMHRGLIAFAWAAWIYRLVLCTTIALLIYNYTFKLLGMTMFVLILWYLLAKPIIEEVMSWRHLFHANISRVRMSVITGLALAFFAILSVPWFSRIEIPAIAQVADLTHVYPPQPAEIVRVDVQHDEFVQESATILHLRSPEIEQELAATKIETDIVKLRLSRITADNIDRSEARVLTRELDSLMAKYRGLQAQREALVVRAPIAGTLLEIDPELHEGRWITRDHRLASLSALESYIVKGYVAASDVDRISPGAKGIFVPDDLTRPSIPVNLIDVVDVGSLAIEIPELASTYGGKILARMDLRQKPVPLDAQYLVTLEPRDRQQAPKQIIRGVVKLEGASVSLMGMAWNRAVGTLIRESGF